MSAIEFGASAGKFRLTLDGENGGGSGEVRRVGDEGSGSGVGGDTNSLEEGGGGEEGGDVGHSKVVGASLGGVGAESGGEEVDVDLLVSGNLLNTVTDPVGVSGGCEGGLVVLREVLGVESVLDWRERRIGVSMEKG